MLCGTIRIGYACYQAFSARKAGGRVVSDDGRSGLGDLVWLAAVPVLAYLLFVFYYLGIEVLRAFLILPGKIDQLATRDEKKDEEKTDGQ